MTELSRAVARLLLAPVLVVALAVLVKGYVDVGDGFAAGIMASLGVLLQYVVFGRPAVASALPVHRAPALAFAGLGVAVAVALAPLLFGGTLLEHAPPPGAEVVTVGTVELITAVAFDVGVFLLVLGAAVGIIDVLAQGREEEPA
jgi:multisubunit Na+/H+ antiporter MnhB subunit